MTKRLSPAWVKEYQQRLGAALTSSTPESLLSKIAHPGTPADLPEHGWYRTVDSNGHRPEGYIRIVKNEAGRSVRGAYRSDPPEGLQPEAIPTVTVPDRDAAQIVDKLVTIDHLAVHFAHCDPVQFARNDAGLLPAGPLDDTEALAIYRATEELRRVLRTGYNDSLLFAALAMARQRDAARAVTAIARVGALFRRRRMIDTPTFAILNLLADLTEALSMKGDETQSKYLEAISVHAEAMSGTGEKVPIAVLNITLMHARRILGWDGLHDYAMAHLSKAQSIQRDIINAQAPSHAELVYDGAYRAFFARFALLYLRNSGGDKFDQKYPLAARAFKVSDELAVRFAHSTLNAWQAMVEGAFSRHVEATRDVLWNEGNEAAKRYTRTLVREHMFYPVTYAEVLADLAANGPSDDDELDLAASRAYPSARRGFLI